jgi:predicted nuclease of predicted toxin-antitoxin system
VSPALIVNENFPAPALRLLREHGLDVLAVREDMPGASDSAVLAKACETGRWLITFDRDYGELVFRRGHVSPPAIVFLRQEPVPATRPADWVLELVGEPSLAKGHFVVLGGRTIRRRPLPSV